MTVLSANHSTMAEWNRRSVLQLLREHEALSRLQLSQMTGLRGSTVTHIVREHIESKLFITTGKRTAQRVGPKEILVRINPDYGYSVGIELSPDYFQLAVLDATGKVLVQENIDTACDLPRAPSLLKGLIDEQVRQHAIPGKLLGIAVGVPGIVDTQRGVILNSMVYDVRDYPIADAFSQVFDAGPIVVNHNVSYAALAEMRLGAARGMQNFIHLFIGQRPTRRRPTFRAYSTALILRGEVVQGTNFAAGEIDDNLRPRMEFHPTAEELACLQQPEQPLTPQLQSLAVAIGKMLGSLVNLLDPQAVVISSNQLIANRLFMALIREETLRLLLPVQNREFSVKMSTLGEQAICIGAALAAADAALVK